MRTYLLALLLVCAASGVLCAWIWAMMTFEWGILLMVVPVLLYAAWAVYDYWETWG